MKYLICAMVILFAASAFAIDVTPGVSVGTFIQKGQKPQICFTGGGDFSIVKKDSAGFQAFAVVTYAYSDRPFGTYSEIQAARTMATAVKTFGFIHEKLNLFYIGTGYGWWHFVNTNGADNSQSAYNLELGLKSEGFRLYLGCDMLPVKEGPDGFYPHFGAMINF